MKPNPSKEILVTLRVDPEYAPPKQLRKWLEIRLGGESWLELGDVIEVRQDPPAATRELFAAEYGGHPVPGYPPRGPHEAKCPAHLEPEPCTTCRSYIAAGL